MCRKESFLSHPKQWGGCSEVVGELASTGRVHKECRRPAARDSRWEVESGNSLETASIHQCYLPNTSEIYFLLPAMLLPWCKLPSLPVLLISIISYLVSLLAPL